MVKFIALFLCAFGLLTAQEREGNFDIRFEPTAQLQTGTRIPFQIRVKDSLNKPLTGAKVTLQIETAEHADTKIYPAPATEPGIYIAKPEFPVAGQWNVYVEVHWEGAMTARTIEFDVSQ